MDAYISITKPGTNLNKVQFFVSDIDAILKAGDVEHLEELVNARKDCIAFRDEDGFTPLLLAASYGNVAAMTTLLNNSAPPHDVDKDGNNN